MGDWDFYLRTLSNSARDSDAANNPTRRSPSRQEAENSEDLAARVYPQINRLFQRSAASLSESPTTSNGLLLLAIL